MCEDGFKGKDTVVVSVKESSMLYLFIFYRNWEKRKIYNFKLSRDIPATAAQRLKENRLFWTRNGKRAQ